jgi:hypothetical protein
MEKYSCVSVLAASLEKLVAVSSEYGRVPGSSLVMMLLIAH